MRRAAHELTSRERSVFALVAHYYESVGDPVPASFVARRLDISRQRVTYYFRVLNSYGWLRTPGSPAIPSRRLPPHA